MKRLYSVVFTLPTISAVARLSRRAVGGWTAKRPILLLFLFVLPGTLLAQALSIGPVSRQECKRLCTDLVYDCKDSVYSNSGMCTIISHTPDFYSGIAVKVPSQQECDDIKKQMGTEWEMQKGWCVEVPPKAPAGAPDLTRVWSSSYGGIHLTRNGNTYEGWYGKENKTIRGMLSNQGGTWIFAGEWGRKNDPGYKGGFRFTFTSPTAFTGNWWYDSNPSSTTPWAGSL